LVNIDIDGSRLTHSAKVPQRSTHLQNCVSFDPGAAFNPEACYRAHTEEGCAKRMYAFEARKTIERETTTAWLK